MYNGVDRLRSPCVVFIYIRVIPHFLLGLCLSAISISGSTIRYYHRPVCRSIRDPTIDTHDIANNTTVRTPGLT